jgi:protein-S-isoprenylcysteine O-methyltransferase Ste14
MSRIIVFILPLAFPAIVGAIIFASAGRLDLPFVWGIVGLMAAVYLALGLFADPNMMRERLSPGPGSRDHLTRALGIAVLVPHWVLAGLDVGRFHWSLIPWQGQTAGLIGCAAAFAVIFWAMLANPFYSSVVRVQKERGHHVIASGPYRFIRHPGYAASIVAMICGGIALGSWVAMLPLIVFVGLFVRRTLLEDRLLKQELEGYAEYAQKVPYRFVAGLF